MAYIVWRKLWRISGLIFPVIYIIYGSKKITFLFSFYVLCFFLLIELLRFLNSHFNSWLFKRFKLILKEEELNRLLNTTFFLIFLNLAVFFFRKEIAVYSVFFVIFGDISSSIMGRYFGRIRIRNKTLEGAVAFFLTCLFFGYLLNAITPIKLPMVVVFWAGLTASSVELFSIIDDNLSVGLASCIVMEIILRMFFSR
jgi:dolichol kinase